MSEFPYKLGPDQAPSILPPAPGQPKERVFGCVFPGQGIDMHEGTGLFYLVEADPQENSQVRIVAYADQFGRMFDGDEPVAIPPARYPSLEMSHYEDDDDSKGYVELCDKQGNSIRACEFVCEGKDGVIESVQLVSSDLPLAGDPGPLRDSLRATDFMSAAYLAYLEFPPLRSSARLFDLGAVFDRLDTVDLFDAVNREVLEAEALWAENPFASAGLERYLVHMLREEGIVGLSSDDLAIPMGKLMGKEPSEEQNEEFAEMKGLPGLPDLDTFREGPNARLIRTASYADTYYIDFSYNTPETCVEDGGFRTHELTQDARKKLLCVEGALNRFLLLARYLESIPGATFAEDEEFCSKCDLWLIDRMCTQAPDPAQPEQAKGRWEKSIGFARACERLSLPYRFFYEFGVSVDGETIGIKVACPTADIMPKSYWNGAQGDYVQATDAERNEGAARYSAHLAILLAACGFHVSSEIEHVSINCVRSDLEKETIVSAELDRDVFEAAFAADDGIFDKPVEFLAGLGARVQEGEDKHLEAVEPFFELEKGIFNGAFEAQIADDEAFLNAEAREMLGVFQAKNLNIFEEHLRAKAAEEVLAALDEGVPAAMDCLKGIHDRTEDLTLRRICQGLLFDFDLGAISEHSYLEVREAFADAYGFKPLMTRGIALYNAGDPKALPVLEELLAKVEAVESFKDTSYACRRYFDSYETRTIYAKRCKEDAAGRSILPLPDEVYLVHDVLAQVYTDSIDSMEDGKKALDHAQRCIELSPARAHSYMLMARVYFMMMDFENEIRYCKKAVEYAWDTRDAAVALYWMAFAYWKTERYDLAVACYRRSMHLSPVMFQQAQAELEELVKTVKGLTRRSMEEEFALMEKDGIPAGALDENAAFMMDVAKAAVDSDAISLGCVLAAQAQRVLRDDAIIPTVNSLYGLTNREK